MWCGQDSAMAFGLPSRTIRQTQQGNSRATVNFPTTGGVLARAAGGGGGAGAGALARVYVEAFAGLFSGGGAHRRDGEHGGGGSGNGNTGSFLSCVHGSFLKLVDTSVRLIAVTRA